MRVAWLVIGDVAEPSDADARAMSAVRTRRLRPAARLDDWQSPVYFALDYDVLFATGLLPLAAIAAAAAVDAMTLIAPYQPPAARRLTASRLTFFEFSRDRDYA